MCSSQPESMCTSDHTLRVYNTAGTCEAGAAAMRTLTARAACTSADTCSSGVCVGTGNGALVTYYIDADGDRYRVSSDVTTPARAATPVAAHLGPGPR